MSIRQGQTIVAKMGVSGGSSSYKGEYSDTTVYNKGDYVYYENRYYICKQDNVINILPIVSNQWNSIDNDYCVQFEEVNQDAQYQLGLIDDVVFGLAYRGRVKLSKNAPKVNASTGEIVGYAKTEDLPTKVSELENDSGFITNEIVSEVATSSNKLVAKSELPTLVNLAQAGKGIELERKLLEETFNYQIQGTPDIDEFGVMTFNGTTNFVYTPNFDIFDGVVFELEFTTPSLFDSQGTIVQCFTDTYSLIYQISMNSRQQLMLMHTDITEYMTTNLSTDTSYWIKAKLVGNDVIYTLLSSDGTILEEKTISNAVSDIKSLIFRIGRSNLPIKINLNKVMFGDWRAYIPAFDGYEINSTIEMPDISGKADKTYVDEELAKKADKSELPTKVSELENDTGYLTAHQDISGKADKSDTYTKSEVDAKVSSVYRFKGSVANYDALPTTGLVVGDVYNIESNGSNYAWDGNDWDKLSETIDLTPYLTKTEASNTYATISSVNGEISTLESVINNKADKTAIPTKTSQLTNDSGYLTSHQDISGKADKSDTYTKTEVDTKISSYQPTITTLSATSGTVNLEANKLYTMAISGTTTFSLATPTNKNVFNQIKMMVKITGTPTINWGTTYFFNKKSPTIEAGNYDVYFDYDNLINGWVCGVMSKGVAS